MQDTLIIDTSNAPCGPGFLPGLRLSEGRFAINRERSRSPQLGQSQATTCLRPPKFRLRDARCGALARRGLVAPLRSARSPLLPSFPDLRAGDGRPVGPACAGAAAGGLPVLPADRVTPAPARRDRSSGGYEGSVGGGSAGRGGGPSSAASGYPMLQSVSLGPRPSHGPRTSPHPGRVGENIRLRPQIRRDNPLNLSILLSGGKETNQDSLSSGERRGKSPAPNPRPTGGRGKCGVRKTACPVSLGGLSPSDRGSARGRCEAGNGPRRAGVRSSRSRVVWECSPKRVVNSI